jgi:death on curing protein
VIPEVAVRDYGLLEAALARPQATAFGKDAYPSLDAKNGRRLTLTNDQAYALVMNVAVGELDQVEEIAALLQAATAPRP